MDIDEIFGTNPTPAQIANTCPACDGMGFTRRGSRVRSGTWSYKEIEVKCDACDGTGRKDKSPCAGAEQLALVSSSRERAVGEGRSA